jgi:hypothetical protein
VRLRVSAPAGTDALLCIKDPDRRFDRSDAGVKRALGLLANDEIIGFLYLGTRVCGASDPVRAVVEDFVCLVNVSNVAFRMSFSGHGQDLTTARRFDLEQ